MLINGIWEHFKEKTVNKNLYGSAISRTSKKMKFLDYENFNNINKTYLDLI